MEGQATTWRKSGEPPPYRLTFGRVHVACSGGYTPHAGNLCWDAATIDDESARRIVAYAARRGWQVTECTEGNPFAMEAS